jgi:hypothetical protein
MNRSFFFLRFQTTHGRIHISKISILLTETAVPSFRHTYSGAGDAQPRHHLPSSRANLRSDRTVQKLQQRPPTLRAGRAGAMEGGSRQRRSPTLARPSAAKRRRQQQEADFDDRKVIASTYFSIGAFLLLACLTISLLVLPASIAAAAVALARLAGVPARLAGRAGFHADGCADHRFVLLVNKYASLGVFSVASFGMTV